MANRKQSRRRPTRLSKDKNSRQREQTSEIPREPTAENRVHQTEVVGLASPDGSTRASAIETVLHRVGTVPPARSSTRSRYLPPRCHASAVVPLRQRDAYGSVRSAVGVVRRCSRVLPRCQPTPSRGRLQRRRPHHCRNRVAGMSGIDLNGVLGSECNELTIHDVIRTKLSHLCLAGSRRQGRVHPPVPR